MALTRRDLLKTTSTIGLGLGLSGTGVLTARAAPQPKKILVLGGTGFIGPHTVRYAVERGHQVSVFTRGQRQSDLPESVEQLVGDRKDDLSALRGREWDAVLDNNCQDYRWARNSTTLLKDACDHYVFVSSISVYNMPEIDMATATEPVSKKLPVDAPIAQRPEGWSDGDDADYAWMKVLSENTVFDAFGERATIVRPTLIVGPGDHTGRWSYWPVRLAEGGEVLAPGNPQHSTQIIDQRDLTEWHVRLIENGTTGIFNGAGPAGFLSMQSMLEQTAQGVGAQTNLTWVDEGFLAEHGINPWSDMPAWLPGYPIMYVDVSAAVAAGLSYRPIAVTARDTLAFEQARPADGDLTRPFSFDRERETAVLKAWHSRA